MPIFGKRGGEELRLRVEGMSCGHCVARVTGALKRLKGVRDVRVSLSDKEAVVRIDPGAVGRQELVRAVEEAGYRA